MHALNWINGDFIDSTVRGQSLSPVSGEVVGTFADGSEPEAEASVLAAHRAFVADDWARDPGRRAKALLDFADRLEQRQNELAVLLSQEMGKTVADAAMEVCAAVPKLRYHAALALTDSGRAAEVKPGMYSMTLRQPLGVAGVIVPWNSPVILAVRSFAPALAAGCTVAMKMPAQTALTNHLLCEIAASVAALPPGALNAFTESGNSGAALLVEHPDVAVISYTGSTAVGKAIMRRAAAQLKPVSLELGGKCPMLVFDDADLDHVVPVLVAAITTFSGQFCMAGSRILAQRGIADTLRRRLVQALAEVRLGSDVPGGMGPVVDRAAAERIDQTIADASSYGKVLLRGGLVTAQGRDAFVRPALVEVEDVTAPLVQQEVFGPVATFEVFSAEIDAVRRANATVYGLAASVWSRDVDRPLRVARELDAGTVWTNTWGVIHDQFEEGGFKQSGVGRLNGRRGLEEFQEIKHLVHVAPAHYSDLSSRADDAWFKASTTVALDVACDLQPHGDFSGVDGGLACNRILLG